MVEEMAEAPQVMEVQAVAEEDSASVEACPKQVLVRLPPEVADMAVAVQVEQADAEARRKDCLAAAVEVADIPVVAVEIQTLDVAAAEEVPVAADPIMPYQRPPM